MKINSIILGAFAALATLTTNLHAASGTWTNRLGGTWSTALNWTNSIVADGADFTADFSVLPTGIVTMNVTNDAPHSLAVLRFGAVTNTFLVGADTITLQTNSGIPNVNAANNTARVGVPLASSQQVLMSGALLAITNDLNTLSGGVVIQCSQFGFMSQGAIGSGVVQLGNGPGGTVAGPGQIGFNAISAATAGTAPVTLTNDFVVRTTRWIAGQNGVGMNAQPIIINGNVQLDMGTNGVRDFALQQPLTINGVLSSVAVPGGGYGVTFGALAGGPLTLGNSGNTFVGNITYGVANTLGINSDGALGYFLNRLVFTGGGTLRADAPFTISGTRTPITLTATATFNTQTNDVQIDPLMSGAGGLIKNGTGRLTIASSANTFTGGVTVNSGTLDLQGNLATAGTVTINNAGLTNGSTFLLGASASAPNISVTVNNGCTFDATAPGGYTFVSPKTLSVPAGGFVKATGGTITMNSGATFIAGSGTSNIFTAVDGSVVADSGSVLIPGTAGTAGTISITNALTLNGQSIQFDLRNNLTEGIGTNDLILVGGALALNGGEKIVLNYMDGALAPGTYNLIRCASQSGSFTLAAAYPSVTLNQSGTLVSLTVGAGAVANNLFWKGDGAGNVWDANVTANWVTNFANPALNYTDPSKVIFDNNGSNNVAVNLVSTVLPNTVTFSNTKPYTISGVGKISGPVTVTVAAVATNTILTDNDNSGGTTFTAGGTLQLGNGGATGSVGSGTIALGATSGKVIINRSSAISFPISASAGTPALIQNGSGTTTLTGATDAFGLVGTVNNGTLQLAKSSSGTVHALASATVNAGGTLQLGGSGNDQITNSATLTLVGGTLDLGGLNETVNILSGRGSVINGGTITATTYVGLTNAGTLAVTNSTLAVTTASAQWLRDPGSVIFEGGNVSLPTVVFTGAGSAGNQNILFNGGITTGGNGETIFGENVSSSVVTFGPNANATVWFWSYRDTVASTFWYNGGNLTLNRLNYRGANAGAAISTHYFNGTTLNARANVSPGFMNAGDGSRVKLYVSTNGLIINNAGFNLGIANILAHDPAMGVTLDGGLTKSGAGTLNLSATNTFNGSVTVNGGTLQLNNAGSYNNVTFADNTTYQVTVVQAGVSLTNSSLTLGTTGGGTQNLIFALGTLGIPTQPVVRVNNVLTNSGPVVVTITAPFLSPGIAPLIRYGSMDAANFASTWSVAAFPYVNLTLTNDTVNKLISVIIDPGVTPKWKGNVDSAWDTTTLNWTSNAIPALYVETAPPGQPVTMDDTAVNFTVDISTATVNPLFVNMSNNTPYTVTGTAGIAGTGAVIKKGSGSLTLNNASGANTYSGITTVSGGSIVAAQPNVLSASSATTLDNSALNFGANNQTIGAITFNNSSLTGSGTLNNGALIFNNGATSSTLPPISGTLALTQNGTGTLDMTNANTWGGTLQVNAGTLRVNNVGSLGSGGFLAATLTRVEAGASLVFDGASGTSPEYIHIRGSGPSGGGALVVTNGNVTLNGGSITALDDNATINIGSGASLTNVVGLNGAPFTLTKIGGGLLYFNTAPNIAANAGTTIDSGACNRVTVNSGATFGGAGTAVTVDVKSGAILAPGNLGIGTFIVSDSLTNAGSILLEISKTGVTLTNDRIVVNTNFVHTGTLTATNIGPDALTAGDTFQLFATNYAAIASAPITLPALGAGLGWTNNLGVDGTIAVISVAGPSIPTAPTNLTFSASGGNLTLAWPSNYVGWILQSQTNLRSVGLTVATNTWFDVAGSDGLTSTNLPISPAQPTVFFRLRYP